MHKDPRINWHQLLLKEPEWFWKFEKWGWSIFSTFQAAVDDFDKKNIRLGDLGQFWKIYHDVIISRQEIKAIYHFIS